ncbi:MAG TPA: hypothetical protein PLQ39_08360 [Acinetobacter sp.]|nr:hypothetical protein [Acinetobacter sp.]
MGLDTTLLWLEQDEIIDNDNLLNDRIIMSWRSNYALNNWVFRFVRKKTGIFNKHKLFDYINNNLIELTHDDLVKLKNDIICNRVRDCEYIYKNHSFVDMALGKVRRGKKVFYEMSW